MNWEEIKTDSKTQDVVLHWQKLSSFRKNHPAIGAGIHNQISSKPYVFSRTYTYGKNSDKVVVGLELPVGNKTISVGKLFKNGTKVKDTYSGKTSIVTDGKVKFDTPFPILLVEKM
jgi:alpha-amylase